MENNIHKGTELNNISETWDRNEKLRQNASSGTSEGNIVDEPETAPVSELEQIIKEEASEYDNANKEDRILGGERATVSDDDNGATND